MSFRSLFSLRNVAPWLISVACACSSARERDHAPLDAAPPLDSAGALNEAAAADATSNGAVDAGAMPFDAHMALDVAASDATSSGSTETSDAALPDTLTVHTQTGPVRGTRLGRARAFLGIPYAKPPVGVLRFAPPEKPTPWSGIREATTVGPACTQLTLGAAPSQGMSEDCLTLDVYAPDAGATRAAPVMVYLYGGGFQIGFTAGIPGEHLARHGIVLVAVNYRLGALSFLAHPALDAALPVPSGNLAIRDQQLALRWVRDNIAAFGGDPSRVTLFGQSAGSISTSLHMFARGSEGLAQRFIMESGTAVGGRQRLKTRAEIQASSENLVRQLCPGDAPALECLRSQPASAFAWAGAIALGPSPEFWPHVDGALIPDMPLRMLARGEISRVPFLVGSTRNEYRFFERLELPVLTRADLILKVGLQFTEYAAQILEHYMPESDAGARDAYARIWTDSHFRCPARMLVQGASALGISGYLYSFDVAPGAHTQELDYVFDVDITSKSYPNEAPLPPLRSVVQTVQTYWLSFAATADPNPPGSDLPRWPLYDRSTNQHLSLAEPASAKMGLADADCEFWSKLFAAEVR